MKNKPVILGIVALLVILGGVVIAKQILKPQDKVTVVQEEKVELPVNVIPVEERPFVTLSPDSTGHYLALGIDKLTTSEGTLEYELVYETAEGEQGAFGRINLNSEKQPVNKQLLLGSKSAGGAVTYYPGVTGGSIALTWGQTKIKESFNFVSFDPEDPSVGSIDGRLTYIMAAKSLKKGDIIVTMKTSGYPAAPTGTVIAGPYAVLTPTTPKSVVRVDIKLPAGEHTNPTIYEFKNGAWSKLKTTLKDDTVTATPTSNVFVVTAN